MAASQEPQKNFVHPDIAKALGMKLLEPLEITRGQMEQAVREARRDMRIRNLAHEFRELAAPCMGEPDTYTRTRVREILDEFEKLDAEKP